MITKEDADFIKSTIGNNYSSKILKYFARNEITRPSGRNFSKQDIFNFFSLDKKRYDPELHNAILDVVEYYMDLPNQVDQKTKAIKEKSEAATSDLG